MTVFGVIFWGSCIVVIGVSYFCEKKFGTKSPELSNRELEHQEITRVTHSNSRPKL